MLRAASATQSLMLEPFAQRGIDACLPALAFFPERGQNIGVKTDCVRSFAERELPLSEQAPAALFEKSGQSRPDGELVELFPDPGALSSSGAADIHRQASFDRFAQIAEQLLHRVALRGAARNRGNLGPIAAFLSLVHHNFDFQTRESSWLERRHANQNLGRIPTRQT